MSNNPHFTSNTNEWYTPKELFNSLDKEFNFNLDPCCTKNSAKCENYFTVSEDGLSHSWGGITYL